MFRSWNQSGNSTWYCNSSSNDHNQSQDFWFHSVEEDENTRGYHSKTTSRRLFHVLGKLGIYSLHLKSKCYHQECWYSDFNCRHVTVAKRYCLVWFEKVRLWIVKNFYFECLLEWREIWENYSFATYQDWLLNFFFYYLLFLQIIEL